MTKPHDVDWYITDTEASAPMPHGVMLTCGLVKLDKGLTHRFYGCFRPPANAEWNPKAEATHGISREKAATFPEPAVEAARMQAWLRKTSGTRKVRLISDNPAFDASWLFALAHLHMDEDIFGHSARRIGDLYCGIKRDFGANTEWKDRFRPKGAHNHNAMDDAVANAQALLGLLEAFPLARLELED